MAHVGDRVEAARKAIARRSSDETDEFLALVEAQSPLSREELCAGARAGAGQVVARAEAAAALDGAVRTSNARAVGRKRPGEPVDAVAPESS
jgi:hypothetical protein